MCRNDPEVIFDTKGLMARMDLFLASQGMGFNAGIERRRRLHEAWALNALSDPELTAMGLARKDIPAFVFADLLG
jgi:hypothetical protein